MAKMISPAERVGRLLTLLGALAGIVVAASTALFFPTASSRWASEKDAATMRKIVQDLEKRTEVLEQSIRQITAPQKGGQVSPTALSASVQQLRADVDGLDAAILADPAKALAVPMLRRDLDSLAQRNRDDLLAARDEIGRVYDLTKWFIGLMFTMAVGLIGLAVTTFMQQRRSP
jgi:hypothetical protein